MNKSLLFNGKPNQVMELQKANTKYRKDWAALKHVALIFDF